MSFNTYWSDPHTVFNRSGTTNIGKYHVTTDTPAHILFSPDGRYYYSSQVAADSVVQRTALNRISDSSNVIYNQIGSDTLMSLITNACLTNRKFILIYNATEINSYDISLNATTLTSTTNRQKFDSTQFTGSYSVSSGLTNLGYIATDTSGLLLGTVKKTGPPVAFFFKRINATDDSNLNNPWRNSHISNVTYITDSNISTRFFENIAIADISFIDSSYGIARTYIERRDTIAGTREIRLYNISYSNISGRADISSSTSPTPFQTIDISNVSRYIDICNNGQWAINRTGTVLAVADPSYNDGTIQCGRILVYSPTESRDIQLEIVEPNLFNLGRFIQIDKNTGWIYSQVSSSQIRNTRKDFLCGYQLRTLNVDNREVVYDYNKLFSLELSNNDISGRFIRQVYYDISQNIRTLRVAYDNQFNTGNINVFTLNENTYRQDVSQIIIDYPQTLPYYLNNYNDLCSNKISINQLISSLQYKDTNNDNPGIILYDISYGQLTQTRPKIIYTRDYKSAATDALEINLRDSSGILLPADISSGYIDIDPSGTDKVNINGTTISFKFRAWDQTRGSDFDIIDISNTTYSIRNPDIRPNIILPGTQDSPYSFIEGVFRTRITYKPSMNTTVRDLSSQRINITIGDPDAKTICYVSDIGNISGSILFNISGDISGTSQSAPLSATFLQHMGIYITDISSAGVGTFRYYDPNFTTFINPSKDATNAISDSFNILQKNTRLRNSAIIIFIQDPININLSSKPSITFALWNTAFDLSETFYIPDTSNVLTEYNLPSLSYKKVAYSDNEKTCRFTILPAAQLNIFGSDTVAINLNKEIAYRPIRGTSGESFVFTSLFNDLSSSNILSNPRNKTPNQFGVYIEDVCGRGLGTFQKGNGLFWDTLDSSKNIVVSNGLDAIYIRFNSTESPSSEILFNPYFEFKLFEKDRINNIVNNDTTAPPININDGKYPFYTNKKIRVTLRLSDISQLSVPTTTINVFAPAGGSQQLYMTDILSKIDISSAYSNSSDISAQFRKDPLNIVLTDISNRPNAIRTLYISDPSNNIIFTSTNISDTILQASDTLNINISGITATAPNVSIDISFRIMDSFGVDISRSFINSSGQFLSDTRPQTGTYDLSQYLLQPIRINICGGDAIQQHDGILVNSTTGGTFLTTDISSISGEIIADITLLQDMSGINSLYNISGPIAVRPTLQSSIPLRPDISWNGSQLIYTRDSSSNIYINTTAGSSHTGYIENGDIYMFGNNNNGRLGNGSNADTSSVSGVRINRFGSLSGAIPIQVACGEIHTAVLCADASLCMFGSNVNGRLGNGLTSGSTLSGMRINRLGDLSGKIPIQVACGQTHTAVLCADASLCMFGNNNNGHLGDRTKTERTTAVVINRFGDLSGKIPIQVACGMVHTAVLCADASLCMFGLQTNGRLGNGLTSIADISTAIVINRFGDLSGKIPIQVACGTAHTAVLCADASLCMFGLQTDGRLGNGFTSTADISRAIVINRFGDLSGRRPVQVACGNEHTAVLCDDNSVITFGFNTSNQLGISTTIISNSTGTPTRINNISGSFLSYKTPVRVACGNNHTIVLCDDGTIITFGSNNWGQLGNSTIIRSYSSIVIKPHSPPINKNYILPSNSTAYTLMKYSPFAEHNAIIANGLLYVFGNNDNGQLGINNTTSQSIPQLNNFGGLLGATPIQVSCGEAHTAVLCADSSLYMFGLQSNGRLGNNISSGNSILPVRINNNGDLSGRIPIQVACGQSHTSVVCMDGTLCMFGYGLNGRLGTNDISDQQIPVRINNNGSLFGKKVIQAACGNDFTIALCSDGTLHGFGDNGSTTNKMNLVDSADTSSNTPKLISSLETSKQPIEVTCGINYYIILYADNTFRSTTNNGNILLSSTQSNYIKISSGANHLAVINNENNSRTLGLNSNGQLGNNSVSNNPTTLQTPTNTNIGSSRKIIDVTCGSSHTLFLTSDGKLYSCGYNLSGRLGLGFGLDNSQNTLFPTEITTLIAAPNITSPISTFPLYKHCIMHITPAAFYLYSQNGTRLFARGFDRQYDLRRLEFGRDLAQKHFKFVLHNIHSTNIFIPNTKHRIERVMRSYASLPPRDNSGAISSISADVYPITTRQIKLNFVPQFNTFTSNVIAPSIRRDTSGNLYTFIQYSNQTDASDTGVDISTLRFRSISGDISSVILNHASYNKNNIGIYITDISNRSSVNKFQYTLSGPVPYTWLDISSLPLMLSPNDRIRFRVSGDSDMSQSNPTITYKLTTGHEFTGSSIILNDISNISLSTVSGEVELRRPIRIIRGTGLTRDTLPVLDVCAQSVSGIKILDASDFWISNSIYSVFGDPSDNRGVLIIPPIPSDISNRLYIRQLPSTDLSLNITDVSGFIMRPTDQLVIKNLATTVNITEPFPLHFRLYSDISSGLNIKSSGQGANYALNNLQEPLIKRFSDISAVYNIRINSRPVIHDPSSYTYILKSYNNPGGTDASNIFILNDISATDRNGDAIFFTVEEISYNTNNNCVFKWSTMPIKASKADLSDLSTNTILPKTTSYILLDASSDIFTRNERLPFIRLKATDNPLSVANKSISDVRINVRINARPTMNISGSSYRYPKLPDYIVNISDISTIRNIFTRISPESNHTMILDASGRAWATGRNISGQCGVRNFVDISRGFTQITLSGGRTATQIAAGDAYTLFLDSSNAVQGTGWNLSGRLGNTLDTTVSGCINVTLSGGRTAKYIATGSRHSVIIDSNNQLQVFGEQANGRLGNRVVTISGLTSPQVITTISGAAAGDPVEVACGERHTLVRTSTNQLWAAGYNLSGLLGISGLIIQDISSFTQVTLSGTPTISQIAAGADYSAFITIDTPKNRLFMFGDASNGKIGNGNISGIVIRPTEITLPSQKNPIYVACGRQHTAIVCNDGTVLTCGDGSGGKLGNNLSTGNVLFPTLISLSGGKCAIGAAVGANHTIIYCSDGTIQTFGVNSFYQLGISGDNGNKTSPQQIQTAAVLRSISDNKFNYNYFYDVSNAKTYEFRGIRSDSTVSRLKVSDILNDISFDDINGDPSGIAIISFTNVTTLASEGWKYTASGGAWQSLSGSISPSYAFLVGPSYEFALDCGPNDASAVPYTIQFRAFDNRLNNVSYGGYFNITASGDLDLSSSSFSQNIITINTYVCESIAAYSGGTKKILTEDILTVDINGKTVSGENLNTETISGVLSKLTFTPTLAQTSQVPKGIYFIDYSGQNTIADGKIQYQLQDGGNWIDISPNTSLQPTTSIRFLPANITVPTKTISIRYKIWHAYLSGDITNKEYEKFYSTNTFNLELIKTFAFVLPNIRNQISINAQTMFNYYLPIANDNVSTIYNRGIRLNIFKHDPSYLVQNVVDFSANTTGFQAAYHLDDVSNNIYSPTYSRSGGATIVPTITLSGARQATADSTLPFTRINGSGSYINISGNPTLSGDYIFWFRVDAMRQDEPVNICSISLSGGSQYIVSISDDPTTVYYNNSGAIVKTNISGLYDEDWNYMRFNCSGDGTIQFSVNNNIIDTTRRQLSRTSQFNLQLGNNSSLIYPIHYRDLYIYNRTIPSGTILETYQKNAHLLITRYSDKFRDISKYSLYITQITGQNTRCGLYASYNNGISFEPTNLSGSNWAFSETTRIRNYIINSAEANIINMRGYIYTGSGGSLNAPNNSFDNTFDLNIGNQIINIDFPFNTKIDISGSNQAPSGIKYKNTYIKNADNTIENQFGLTASSVNGIVITDITSLEGRCKLYYTLSRDPPIWIEINISDGNGLVLPKTAYIDISLNNNRIFGQRNVSRNPEPLVIKYRTWNGTYSDRIARQYIKFNKYTLDDSNKDKQKDTDNREFNSIFSRTESTYNIPIYPTVLL